MITFKIVSVILLLILAWINAYYAGGNFAHASLRGNVHGNLTVAIMNVIASIGCLIVMTVVISSGIG